jgi:DNA (cytosine-5)-methyltransferase 1
MRMKSPKGDKMKQASLFAGVGAFELAGERNGVETVFSCELDKHAAKVLKHRFPKTEVFNDDVRKVNGRELIARNGKIDILTAGFPCQAFSIAGKREGFADATRGTLFFEVARLADEIRPPIVILENVKGLLSHDGGKTFAVIISRMGELGYDLEWQLLNSKDFGVPQNRERVFIVGHLRGKSTRQIFPIGNTEKLCNTTAADKKEAHGIASTLMAGQDKSWTGNFLEVGEIVGFDGGQKMRPMKSGLSPTLKARARQDGSGQPVMKTEGSIRRLIPRECERLMGLPDNWTLVDGMSDTQRYKQCGNSIVVPVLEEIYRRINE